MASFAPAGRWVAHCLLAILLAVWASTARSESVLSTAIAPQPLAGALAEFAHQTGLQLVYVSQLAKYRTSKGARAGSSPTDALAQLLDGTGLSFQFLNARTVRIVELAAVGPTSLAITPEVPLRRAERQMDSSGWLDDIVVTGLRGNEQLSRVPASIAVWSPEAMDASGIYSFDQIALLTPGVEYDLDTTLGPGIARNVSIRGVNNTGGSTTTRVFLDGTPIHSMQSNFGDAFPITFDLDRIEVLRGPQGALLGEGTEGGAIRFTHNQPSLTTFTGQARAEVATTRYGAASHEAGLAGGGPLVEDKLGFRASVWERVDGGYIDRVNPFTGAVVDPNSNTQRSKSIRAALTWAPTASVRITPSEMYQSISLHDTPVFYEYLSKPPQGIFRSGRLVRQPADDTFYLSALKVTANLPFGTLSSDTSYFHRTATAVADITTIYCWVGGYCHNPLGREYPSSYTNALSSVVDLNGRTFIQELRLISPSPGARFTWLVGAQYSNTSQSDRENDYNDVGILQPQQFRSYRGEEIQRAIYGEASIAILTRLGATLGLRIARDSYAWTSTPYAIDFTGDCCFAFSLSERDKPLAPKMSLTYTLDQDHLLYATAAKGYRMGGVNPQRLTACYAQPPQVFDPDSVWNYEVGSKNTVFNARLQLDASAFQMSWRNLQQAVDVPCYFGWNKNGARINGFDLTARAFLTQRLKVDLAVEYVDARFTETVSYQSRPLVAAGDSIGTLPQVPSPWSATTSLDYSLPLAGRPSVILHAENSIHTRNPGPFTRPLPVYAPNSADPTTSVLNLRATAAWSALNLSLFVDNALGSQPTLQRNSQAGVPGATLFFATTFRPRTVGISLNVRH